MAWLTMAVEATFAWPTRQTEVAYLGKTFVITPETDELAAGVSVRYNDEGPSSASSARETINRFLSAVAWAEQGGVRELSSIGTGGPVPARLGKPKGRFVTHTFRADYLPEPKDDRTRRALAIFREASTLNSGAYAFLGYFKVLNVLFPSGSSQTSWINAHLGQVTDAHARKRLLEIQKVEADIGNYLYVQGRCAVAHAYSDPVVDPDAPEDMARLTRDVPLIKDLACTAIQSELGVISLHTYYAVHLYELAGFADILGQSVVDQLKAGSALPPDSHVDIPNISIRLRDHAPFDAFENLTPVGVQLRIPLKKAACSENRKPLTHSPDPPQPTMSRWLL